jgi:hypothetical protein
MTEQEKDARIVELEALVESLTQQLKKARETVASLQTQASRRWFDDRDYLPYEDRDR